MKQRFDSPAIVFVAAVVVALFSVWPTYGPSPRLGAGAAAGAAARIVDQLGETAGARTTLQVGWYRVELDLPQGTPLAGYGARKGKPATGSLDRLWAQAVAISDGLQTAVILGGDVLIVPPNITRVVKLRLAQDTGISTHGLFFTATHTHAGPGGIMPGLVGRAFAGRYRRDIAESVGNAFVTAAAGALDDLESASVAYHEISVPDLVRNRTRSRSAVGALVDDAAQLLVFRKPDEHRQLVFLRYSAHATVIGAETMEFSAGYPGETRRAIERVLYSRAVAETACDLLPVRRTTAFFAAGAAGSMGPDPPGGNGNLARAESMGVELGTRIADALPVLDFVGFHDEVDLRFAGIDARLPPLQIRVVPGVRLSPLLLRLLGLDRSARVSVLDLGVARLIGFPCDLSGETASVWREAAGSQTPAILTSFSGGYAGYVSPDDYYGELYSDDRLAYETGIMSWTGPRGEAYFRELFRAAMEIR